MENVESKAVQVIVNQIKGFSNKKESLRSKMSEIEDEIRECSSQMNLLKKILSEIGVRDLNLDEVVIEGVSSSKSGRATQAIIDARIEALVRDLESHGEATVHYMVDNLEFPLEELTYSKIRSTLIKNPDIFAKDPIADEWRLTEGYAAVMAARFGWGKPAGDAA